MRAASLLVCEPGTDAWFDGPVFEVSFDPNLPAESVRERHRAANKFSVAVAEAHRPIKGKFEEQILNRFFTDAFLRFRPRTVAFDLVVGATIDLIRLAKLYGARVAARLPSATALPDPESRGFAWLNSALDEADAIWTCDSDQAATMLTGRMAKLADRVIDRRGLNEWLNADDGPANDARSLDYSLYEFGLRDHGLLKQIQRREVDYFRGCKHVLDLACGAGIFLDLLGEASISASGVERNPSVAHYAQGLGFNVYQADALEYLRDAACGETNGVIPYDGVHCSHFVEHLPVAAVQQLLQLVYDALDEGGVLVLVFPDPESIRSQLLGFWKDPEHVRFYHPELIDLMVRTAGFEPVASNRRATERDIGCFPARMPNWPERCERPLGQAGDVPPMRWWRRLLKPLSTRIEALEQVNAALAARLEELEASSRASKQAIETLWMVNRTWSWDDDAILCFRKPALPSTQIG